MILFKEHDFDDVDSGDEETAKVYEKEENDNRAMLDKFYASKVIDTTAVPGDDEDAPAETDGAIIPADEEEAAGSVPDPPAVDP